MIGRGMMIGDVLERKEDFLDFKNIYFIQSKKRLLPKIFVKNSNFLHGLFLLKTGLAMTFGDVLDRKEALLDCKKCISYSRKTRYFAKGLTHDFSQKFKLSSVIVSFY